MEDIDALLRLFGKSVAAYLIQVGQMRHRNIVERPAVYSVDDFLQSPRPQRVLSTATPIPQPLTSSRFEYFVASLRIFSSPSTIEYPTYYNSSLRCTSTAPTMPLLPIDINQTHTIQNTFPMCVFHSMQCVLCRTYDSDVVWKRTRPSCVRECRNLRIIRRIISP